MAGRLEKLFTRYRERGDAGALAEVFDATSEELFRLAQHLVRDPLTAEDVLQETFVAAIDAAPRWDAERPLVPWLTGILARKASESRRRARRQVDPLRIDERGERDPAHTAEDSEFSAALREALARLPELYREVLERHLLDGARPAEIARDLERSPGAVRMQLFRGLEQLRRALPAGFAAGAVLAAFAPRGMAAVREAVVAHATAQGALIAAAAGGAAVGVGAWTLAGWAALAAVVLWGSVLGVRALAPDDVRPASPVAPQGVVARDDDAALRSTPSVAVRDGVEFVAPQPRGRLVLRGRVAGPEGEARGAVELGLRGVARYDWPEERTLRARLASDGTFEVELEALLEAARERGALDALELTVDHPDWLPERVRLDAGAVRLAAADARELELWVEVALRPALVVEGVVERAQPGAAPEVGLLAVDDGVVDTHWLERVRADAQGRFRLRAPAAGEVEVVACAADTLADAQRLWIGAGGAALPRALRLAPGVRFEGRLELPGLEGEIESVRLSAHSSGPTPPSVELAGRPLSLRDGAWRVASAVAPVDGDGSFLLRGLEALPQRLTPHARQGLVMYPLAAFERECTLVQSLERRTFEIAAARLDVRLADAAGVPRPGAFQVGVGEWFAGMAAGPEGTRRFALPPDCEPVVWLTDRADGPRTLPRIAAGERREVTLEVAEAPHVPRLELALELPHDAPTSFAVALHLPGEAEPFEVRTLERSGKMLELVDPPAQAFDVELFADGAHRHFEDGWRAARLAVPTADARRTRMSVALERGARLRLVARDASGRAQPLAVRLLDLWGVPHDVRFLRRGSFDQGFTEPGHLSPLGDAVVVPNLAPGLWTVEYEALDGSPRRRHVRLEVGDATLLELEP